MKKSLLLVLGVLVSSVAMAEGNVVEGRLGYSFGEGKLTEDVTKKVVLTGEYRREVMPNLEVGLGLDVKRADEVVTKKVNNNYAVVTRTGLPVYGVVQYNFKSDSDVVPYIKGRLGVVLGRDYQVKEVAPVATTRPGNTTTTQPAAPTDPAATQPATGNPTATQPAAPTDPAATQPATGNPTATQPAAPTDPAATQPATGNPTATQPAAPTDPAATQPATGNPTATQPATPGAASVSNAAPVATAAPVANAKKEFNGNALYAGIGVGVNYKNFVVDLSYNYTTGRKLSDTDLNNIQTAGVRKEVKELVKSGTGVVTLSVGYTLGF